MGEIKENNLKACIIVVIFSNEFNSIDRNKMAEIFRSFGISMETVNAICMSYENTKSII